MNKQLLLVHMKKSKCLNMKIGKLTFQNFHKLKVWKNSRQKYGETKALKVQTICISLVKRSLDLLLAMREKLEQLYNTKLRRIKLRVPKLSRNMIRSLSTWMLQRYPSINKFKQPLLLGKTKSRVLPWSYWARGAMSKRKKVQNKNLQQRMNILPMHSSSSLKKDNSSLSNRS